MTPFVLFAALAAGGLRSPWTWTLFAVFTWAAVASRPPLRRLPAAPLWGAVLGWAFLSAARSPEPLVSLPAAAYAATTFAWLLLGATRSGEDERRWGARLLWISATVLAAYAAAALIPSYRAVGLLYPYYNYTAALVAAAGAAAFAARPYGRAPLGLLGFAAAASYLLWCGSRGGLIGLGAAAAFSLWRSGRRALVAAAALAVAAALLTPSAARDSLLKLERPGSHARPQIWRAALEVALDHPLFGEGPGRFERGFLRHQVPTPQALGRGRYALVTGRAHSQPLDAAAETGFIGLALLLAALWGVWRLRPSSPEASREPLLAAAAALGTQAMGDSIFALPALGWLFAWLLGAACTSSAHEAPRISEPARKGLAMAGLLLASCAWMPGWFVGQSLERDPLAAVSIAPYDSGLWEAAAKRDYKRDDLPRALKALRIVSVLRPYDARPKVLSAEILSRAGSWTAARALAAEAALLEPDCGQARLIAAEAALREGDRAGAVEQLEALRGSRSRPLDGHPGTMLIGHDPALLSRLEAELSR